MFANWSHFCYFSSRKSVEKSGRRVGRGWGSFILKTVAKMMELTSNGWQTAKSRLFFSFYINIPKRNEFAFSFAKSSNTDRVQTLLKLIRGLFLEKPGKPFCVCRVYIIIIIINFIYISSISLTVLGAYIQDQSFSFKKFWNEYIKTTS